MSKLQTIKNWQEQLCEFMITNHSERRKELAGSLFMNLQMKDMPSCNIPIRVHPEIGKIKYL